RPANFGVVVPGVYRSSFPQAADHAFLEGLKLKTIITLVQKDFPEGYTAFISRNGIKHHVFDMSGTKKEEIPIKTMISILRLVLDRQNHPLLIHCNHGKHRTGCVVAIVRKVSGWDLDSIVSEYKRYAQPKVRDCDVKYITEFELAAVCTTHRCGTERGC
ncbi:protein-tyrosine phosphatase, partial [Podospora appendiculata]